MFRSHQSCTDPNRGAQDRGVPKTDLSAGNSPICTLGFKARCSKWWQMNSAGTLLWPPGSVCARTQTPSMEPARLGQGPAEEERGGHDKDNVSRPAWRREGRQIGCPLSYPETSSICSPLAASETKVLMEARGSRSSPRWL